VPEPAEASSRTIWRQRGGRAALRHPSVLFDGDYRKLTALIDEKNAS
jgi:hypothetical protein